MSRVQQLALLEAQGLLLVCLPAVLLSNAEKK